MNDKKKFSYRAFLVLGVIGIGSISTQVLAEEKITTEDFLVKVKQRDLAEVESGAFALEHSHLQAVKAYAQSMIDEHMAAKKEITNLAHEKNVELADEADAIKKTKLFVNKQFDVDAFDIAYVRNQVSAHHRMVVMFRRAIESDDVEVSAFAKSALPQMMHNLYMAQQLLDTLSKPAE